MQGEHPHPHPGSAPKPVKAAHCTFSEKSIFGRGRTGCFSGSDDDLESRGYKRSRFISVPISSPVEALALGSFGWALISTEMKNLGLLT